MEGVSEDHNVSVNIIPSSNIEPPPPVEFIIPKVHSKSVLAEESFETADFSKVNAVFDPTKLSKHEDASFFSESHSHTQQEDFEDIRQSLSARQSCDGSTHGHSSQAASQNRDQFFKMGYVPESQNIMASSSPLEVADSNILLDKMFLHNENQFTVPLATLNRTSDFASPICKTNQPEITPPSKMVRSSVPIYKDSQRLPSPYLTSVENTRDFSCLSVNDLANDCNTEQNTGRSTTTTTTNNHSGSDLFYPSDASGARQKLANLAIISSSSASMAKRSTMASTSTNITDLTDAGLPTLSYTLTLTVLPCHRSGFPAEEQALSKFTTPVFSKVVAWKSCTTNAAGDGRVALDCLVEAAKLVTDAFEDWRRGAVELHNSEDAAAPRQVTAAAVPSTSRDQRGRLLSTLNFRQSSSSSDYFIPRKQQILSTKNTPVHPAKVEKDESTHTQESLNLNTLVLNPESQTNEETLVNQPTFGSIESEQKTETCRIGDQLDRAAKPEPGVLVYARWKTDDFYYAGHIVRPMTDNRFRIRFDDNSSAVIACNDILLHDVLPVGSSVAIDPSGCGEYEAGYVVAGHTSASSAAESAPQQQPSTASSYVIKDLEDGRQSILERRHVAIDRSEVRRLMLSGSLSVGLGPLSTDAPLPTEAGSGPNLKGRRLPCTSSSRYDGAATRPCPPLPSSGLKLASPDVSLDNVVYGKRSLKETRCTDEPPASAPSKRRTTGAAVWRRARRCTSTEHGEETERALSPGSTASSDHYQPPRTEPTSTRTGRKRRVKRMGRQRESRLSKRDSQIWACGRRILASASMVNRPRTSTAAKRLSEAVLATKDLCNLSGAFVTPSSEPHISPISPAQTNAPNPLCAAAADDDDDDSQQKTQPMRTLGSRLSYEPILRVHRRRPSRVTTRLSLLETEELARLCRKYAIPEPNRDLFSKWDIVYTKGVQSAAVSVPGALNSSNQLAVTQLAASGDARFLQLLITAGGGHLISAIEATDISTSPADGRQPRLVALVAPTAIRTLKFLQGLATLGRVPLLRATWLLDACLVSSGLQPTMTTTATTSEASQEAFDRGGAAGIDPPEDVPLKLLASATNREVYELPRGVDRLTNRTIAPTAVAPLYASLPGDRPLTVDLFAAGGIPSARVVAIVTDDLASFGQGWSSILKLATANHSDGENDHPSTARAPPRILTAGECVDWLTAWKLNFTEGDEMRAVLIVLVDQDRDHRVDLADSSWFLPLAESGAVVEGSSYLTKSHKKNPAERYFTVTRYFPNVGGEDRNDLCVMQHSNRICVFGLAPGHHLFGGCRPTPKGKKSNEQSSTINETEHKILGVDFQISNSFNLLGTTISGRRKRGCHHLQHPSQCIGYAVCDRGERHSLTNGLLGRLYECNARLTAPGDANTTNNCRLPLDPIGHCASQPGNQTYLALVMPPRRGANTDDKSTTHEEKIKATNSSVTCSPEGIVNSGIDWETYRKLRDL